MVFLVVPAEREVSLTCVKIVGTSGSISLSAFVALFNRYPKFKAALSKLKSNPKMSPGAGLIPLIWAPIIGVATEFGHQRSRGNLATFKVVVLVIGVPDIKDSVESPFDTSFIYLSSSSLPIAKCVV